MLTRRSFLITSLAAPANGLLATPALGMSPRVFNTDRVAIRGYDAVAYFKESNDIEGSADFSIMWKGVEWRFANAENLADFEANPERWPPQYGGHCAFAMAHYAIAPTAANAWTVHNNELYLNANRAVRARWAISKDRFIEQADANWPSHATV